MKADLPVANELGEGVGVPPDWQARPLKDVADIRFSNVDKKTSSSELPVRLCNYTDVYFNDYITADMAFMRASATRSEIARFGLSPGDVIITKDSETPDDIGVPTLVDSSAPDLLCGYHLAMLRPLPGSVDPAFLAKQLAHNRILRYFGRQANGSTRYGLSTGAIERTPVWFPSIDEQREIGRIARLLDAAIQRTEVVIAKFKQLRAGLLQDLLTRGIDDHGQLRDPRTQPAAFAQTACGLLPRTWDVLEVDAFVAQPSDIVIGPFGSNLLASDYRASGAPVVFVRDIRPDGFVWNSHVYVTDAKCRELKAHTVRPGDVVVSKMGLPPCIATVYPTWMGLGVITADVIRVRPRAERILPFWLATAINSPAFQAQVRRITGGVTRPKVTLNDFRRLRIQVPPKPEQEQIQNRLDSLVQAIIAVAAQHQKLEQLKAGLMHDLLTGEVAVTTRLETAEAS